jgi:outer membrane protein TolC
LLIFSQFFDFHVVGQKNSFSLAEAQEYAVNNSYQVKDSQLDLEIAKKKLKETLSVGLPQIDASLDYNYFIALPTSLIPGEFFDQPGEYIEVQFGTKHNATAGVVLQQLIFDGRYFIGLQYAKIYSAISEETLVKTRQDIKADVAQTYYMILVNEEALRVLDSTLVVLEKTRYETGQMFKEGFVEETDYDQLTLTVKATENSRNDLANQNQVSYNLLKYQMGLDLDEKITLTQSLDDVLREVNFDALINQTFVIDNNIDYRLISMQEQMKVLNLKNEKASYWPAINGSVILQTNAQRDEFTFTNTGELWFPMSSAGATLSLPVFSSGMRKARVGQAKLELEQVRNAKTQLKEGLELDLLRSRSSFNTALENYYNEEENVALSRKIYRKTLLKYNEGVATSAELTQQHNQFFDAESRYFRNTLALLNAKIELDKVLGNL